MLNAFEIIPTRPTPTETVIPNEEKAASPVSLLCNLTGGTSFREDYERPHLPVLAAFGGDPLHVCRLYGSWDLDRAVSENAGALVRSKELLQERH